MTDGSIAVVALGLLSALAWGLGDFGGGLTSRHAPAAGVLVGSQLSGAVVSLALAAALGERGPSGVDVGWALASSGFGSIGLSCLYIGLARGRMGVVAPVTGVLVAAIPAIAGIALQGAPPPLVLVGIALAISSVVVVSRVGDAGDGRPSGLRWGIGAGLGLGAVALTLSRLSHGQVFGPLAIMRVGEAALICLVVLASIVVSRQLLDGRGSHGHGPDGQRSDGRRPDGQRSDGQRSDGQSAARRPTLPRAASHELAWRVPRRLWPAVVAIGALDMLGTGFYIAATQAGPLAVAGVLSALYPVTTVILAVVVLRERLARWHVLGIAISAAAIVLITTGSNA